MIKTTRKSHVSLMSAILISFTLTTILPGCINKLWRGGDAPEKMQTMKKGGAKKKLLESSSWLCFFDSENCASELKACPRL